jgi:hypothetical protein
MNKIISDWVEILKWPLVTIGIVVFLAIYFKKSFSNLIGRINKFKFWKVDADVSQVNQGTDTTVLAHSSSTTTITTTVPPNRTDSLEYINRILGAFIPATIEQYKGAIENEIHLSRVTDPNERMQLLYSYSQALVIVLNFERFYNKIFGSQIYLLEYLNTGGIESKQNLKKFYNDAAKQFPEIYKSIEYQKYLTFLIDSALVINNNDIFEITTSGRDFLKFLVETGKTVFKPY